MSLNVLIGEKQFSAARELLVRSYNISPESEYLIMSLMQIHIEQAMHFLAEGDSTEALKTLRSCMKLGDNKGLYGGLLKMYTLTAVGSGFYYLPFDGIRMECEFSERINNEIVLDFLAPFKQ